MNTEQYLLLLLLILLFVPSNRELPDFVETRERVVRLEKEA